MNVTNSPYDKNRIDFERNEYRNVFVIMRYVNESPLQEIEDTMVVGLIDLLRLKAVSIYKQPYHRVVKCFQF